MLEREGLLNVREMVGYRQDPEGSRVCVGGEDREGLQQGSEWRLCTVSLGSTSCLRGAQGGYGRKVKPLAVELTFMSETLVTAGHSMTDLGS